GDRRIFAAVVEVGIDDLLAVQDDDDPTPLGADGHGVPLARGLDRTPARADDVIDRASVLVIIDADVFGVVIVENLNFHADAADVSLFRGANVNAAVAARGQAVLQPQLEVVVLALGAQPAALTARADDHVLFDFPDVFLAVELLPAAQVG